MSSLKHNRFYGLSVNNNTNNNTNNNNRSNLLQQIKSIQARYKHFIHNYTTFKDLNDTKPIGNDNIFEFDVDDFLSKSTLSEQDKVKTLKNYKQFLEFVEKTILKEYLGIASSNFSDPDTNTKLSEHMKVEKVIKDPIKLYFANNLSSEDKKTLEEKHKAYLNYKHYYNVKNDASLNHNENVRNTNTNKSSRRITKKKSITRRQNISKKNTIKRKLKSVKDEYCKENPDDNIKDQTKLWRFFDLMNLDRSFTELCEDDDEDTFYDSIKYDDQYSKSYESFYTANLNTISFYFERYKELLEFMKQLTNGNIKYDPNAHSYVLEINSAHKLFRELYKQYGEEYFKDKSFIEFFCNEYHTTRNCLIKYKLTLLKYMKSSIDKQFFNNPSLIVFQEIIKTNFEEDYIKDSYINKNNLRIIPLDFDVNPIELELKPGIYISPHIYFQKINDEIIKYICNNVYWSFFDKLIPDLTNNTELKTALVSFLNEPDVINVDGTQQSLKYQLKLLKTFIKNDTSESLFDVDENNDYIGITDRFLETFSNKLNKLNKKQIIIGPLENGQMYHCVRYLFIASLFLVSKNIISQYRYHKNYNVKLGNLPDMNHLFYTTKLNWFVLYLVSRNNVDFPIRIDVSNIYDDRLKFINEQGDMIFNMAELGTIKFQDLFFNTDNNLKSPFNGMTIIPYKSNKENNKISLFFIFYFKTSNEIQNINMRKRFLYDKHINRSFGITSDEIKYLLKYSGMSIYKINRTLIKQIPNIKANEKSINYYKSLLFFTRKTDSELTNFSKLLEKVKVEFILPSKSEYNKLNYKITYAT